MTEEVELLLEMYKVQVARSEHYENLRATITNVVIALAAALVALATFDNTLTVSDRWLGCLLTLLGVFGFAASHLHGNRSRRHGKRAAKYRNALHNMSPKAGINDVRERVPSRKSYLNRMWTYLHVVIVAVGVTMVIFSFGM